MSPGKITQTEARLPMLDVCTDSPSAVVTIFLLHPRILLLFSFSIHRTWHTTRIIATHLFLIVGSHSILLRFL